MHAKEVTIFKIPIGMSRPMVGINQPQLTAELFVSLMESLPPYTAAPMEQFEVDLMDFEMSGPGELVVPLRPTEWAPLEPR